MYDDKLDGRISAEENVDAVPGAKRPTPAALRREPVDVMPSVVQPHTSKPTPRYGSNGQRRG